ncbi:unnamed protein product [Notodromas monacha]|uniref:Uncharacterized protein n=1 Tax=Notodromas monacha TaxID=399045 RepID=A0A7R9BY11_9CRUS|nr:unnamed protein product [Notodromas monacha]CAG0923465.1 unnamed protein product [Notodromas monacha]
MFMSLLFLSTFLAFNPATITNSSRLDDGRSELQNGKFLRLPISQRQSGKSCDNLAGNFDEDSESQPEISTFMHPFYARIEGDLSRSNSDNGGEGESVFRYVLSAGALISNRSWSSPVESFSKVFTGV